MTEIYLIRHGATAGNMERRYIGRTDEPLCPEGRAALAALSGSLPAPDVLCCSPMLRARETAALLFPGVPLQIAEGLRETDFGVFEGKTAAELSDCAAYRAWVDSGCTGPIPGGEDVGAFKRRVTAAFLEAVSALPAGARAAFVMHGGGIMAVMEAFDRPAGSFYDYHVKNGGYFRRYWGRKEKSFVRPDMAQP